MTSEAKTVQEYIDSLPDDRKLFVQKLRDVIIENLPKGFQEGMGYGMMGYSVPHSIYPKGYHCKPTDPLPFMGLASQKNSINFYHMGIYANKDLHDWFVSEYPKHSSRKLDMGKSCIRFKKFEEIPFDLIGELVTKVSVENWIETYESAFNKK
ncbi:DUF1801 domain-containing protein [Flavobacterium urocaniciphilum]|uniref:YdhG-like domain-containing protein n=1 Tax=Flavobacterium urocaniciphilum TaxID=1299341 RepID=A0A1H8ZFG7_9FLAO|nr:DUF1801 domain-containing protein [Flavobacterium urocaniciphilum]SEP63154.1 protein of unknown function (DU1801) [Flavobacterium urocaniciphilum]